jgi:hypothetical protein
MKYRFGLFCILLIVVIANAQTFAEVLATYDLTHTTNPTNDPAVRRRDWDEQHLVSALQGLVNRDKPRLYVFLVGSDGQTDHFWLDYLRSPDHWLANYALESVPTVPALLKRFSAYYHGVVVYDEKDVSSSLVASTIAGAEDVLPVRYDRSPGSLYHELVEDAAGPRLVIRVDLRAVQTPNSVSRKCGLLRWAMERYLVTGKCDPRHLAYYPNIFGLTSGRASLDRTLLCNHDYFIAHKSFFFDLTVWDDEAPGDDLTQAKGEDLRTLLAILHAAHDRLPGNAMIHVGGFTPWDQKYTDHTGGKHEGVATEWRYAEILSCFDAYMDADAPGIAAMANASVFQHFPLKERYQQPSAPTEATLRTKGYLDAGGHVLPGNYATFYVGDYDSAAWLYQKLPSKWSDSARGKVALGWAFDPALELRFPVGLAYARETATANDSFMAGDSGYGYLNPGNLVGERKWSHLPSGLGRWQALCAAGYRRWDLSITGFIIDGNAPAMTAAVKKAYARFSPAGVVAQKIAEREMVEKTPFLRMNADLEKSTAAAQVIGAYPERAPTRAHYQIFRTILWSPTEHERLIDTVHQTRGDIRFIGPEEMFLLMAHNPAG